VKHLPEVAHEPAQDERKIHSANLAKEVEQESKSSSTKHRKPMSNVEEYAQIQEPDAITAKSKVEQRHRVLLVEDNIINQRVLSRKLKGSGFEVTEASNGQEALDAWDHGKFDCILMDQEMPVMDGNSATKEIRALEKEKGGHILILGVTANVRKDQQADMLEAGMDDIVHKPYKMQELSNKIHLMIDRALRTDYSK
jgi:CheY-like chemotaxis protein